MGSAAGSTKIVRSIFQRSCGWFLSALLKMHKHSGFVSSTGISLKRHY